MSNEVRIEMTGHGLGKVFIDGHEVEGVRTVKFVARGGVTNRVEIELAPKVVKVVGPADVTQFGDVEKQDLIPNVVHAERVP